MCILMHGDREVSAKQLARVIGVKATAPCKPEVADRHSGYQVGGTSPFGLKRAMPSYMERSIGELATIWINGSTAARGGSWWRSRRASSCGCCSRRSSTSRRREVAPHVGRRRLVCGVGQISVCGGPR